MGVSTLLLSSSLVFTVGGRVLVHLLHSLLHSWPLHCSPPMMLLTRPNMESSGFKTFWRLQVALLSPRTSRLQNLWDKSPRIGPSLYSHSPLSRRPLQAWLKNERVFVQLDLLNNKEINKEEMNKNTPVCLRVPLCSQRRTDVVDKRDEKNEKNKWQSYQTSLK